MGFTFKGTYAEAIRIRKGDNRISSAFLLYGATGFSRQYPDKDRRDFPSPFRDSSAGYYAIPRWG